MFLYETKFTVGKWQVVGFTAGKLEERSVVLGGEIRHLGESPQAVPD